MTKQRQDKVVCEEYESLPDDTSEHNHIVENDQCLLIATSLLGHLNVDREIVPKPSMIKKN
jgi:hypothetical protein